MVFRKLGADEWVVLFSVRTLIPKAECRLEMGTHKTWTPNMDPQSGPPSGPPYGPQYGPPSNTTNFGLDRQPFSEIVRKFESG